MESRRTPGVLLLLFPPESVRRPSEELEDRFCGEPTGNDDEEEADSLLTWGLVDFNKKK